MVACSRTGVLLFGAALVAGTGCSIMSKILLEVQGTTLDGSTKSFDEPVFQTIGMFAAMMLALVFRLCKRSCFDRVSSPLASQGVYGAVSDVEGGGGTKDKPLPLSLFFLMALPSTFDLLATYLCTFGLMYVPVSLYQMLRGGSSIAITSILKHFFIEKLELHHWVGVAISVLSILLCAQSAKCSTTTDGGDDDAAADNAALATWGVLLILLGGTVQAMQYVFEERVMGEDMIGDDVGDPAYLVVGLEGFWGTLLCVCVLYPITYLLPGDDNGSLESPWNALHMVGSSGEIQNVLFWYVSFIFAYNLLAIMVTKKLDSVWHSILDLFRPGTVWGFDLFLYYSARGGAGQAYGEPWIGGCSSWQLLGLLMLLLSTAIYAELVPLPAFLFGRKKQGGRASYSSLQKSPGRSPFLARQAARTADDAIASSGGGAGQAFTSQNYGGSFATVQYDGYGTSGGPAPSYSRGRAGSG